MPQFFQGNQTLLLYPILLGPELCPSSVIRGAILDRTWRLILKICLLFLSKILGLLREKIQGLTERKLKHKEVLEAKTGLQKPDFVVYLSSGSNLLDRLRRNQSFSFDG
jgi:hypothetical protein